MGIIQKGRNTNSNESQIFTAKIFFKAASDFQDLGYAVGFPWSPDLLKVQDTTCNSDLFSMTIGDPPITEALEFLAILKKSCPVFLSKVKF